MKEIKRLIKKGLKVLVMTMIIALSLLTNPKSVEAKSGEMFYFGGVTEGSKLPKTIESFVTTKKKKDDSYTYKEMVFLKGMPKVVECTMTVKMSNTKQEESGSYTINYVIKSIEGSEVELNRNITLLVKYRTVDNQVVKDYTVDKWSEDITLEGEKFTLDSKKSSLNLPTHEFNAPAITYFKTVISNQLVYNSDNSKVVITHEGQSFGYNTHWSSVETQNIDMRIESKPKEQAGDEGEDSNEKKGDSGFTMVVNIRPSVKMNKTLIYDTNTPYAIAYQGNYLEVIKNSGGLVYDITKAPENVKLKASEKTGRISIPSFNSQEILITPKNVSLWNGNFAEEDIKKLFSLEILEGDTKYFVPNQALTRSQYIRMIVKALGYQPYTEKAEMAIFEDVPSSHVNYGYVVEAYNRGIITGTGDGKFKPDSSINRQEAFSIYMRALNLSNLASSNVSVTPFIDDNEVDMWAKRDITALYNLGLVKGESGYVKPKAKLSKAEGAAIVNRMVDYLREGIEADYVDRLINY